MRVADYVMQRLVNERIKHVFLVTGRGMLYLSDALAREKKLCAVPVHHEQAASYAAMAYAQQTNSFGVAMVSTGCAATNTITGVMCAWQDNLPCIFISGQNKLSETTAYTGLPIRTYGQQETNIINLVKPITKYAKMIIKPDEIAYEMDKALYFAQEGRKGPVWIDIPLDIQNSRVEESELKRFVPNVISNIPLESEIEYIVKEINCSKRPLILYGSGIRSAGAEQQLLSFIKNNKIPAVYSNSSVDILDNREELIVGCVGAMASNRAANFAIQNSDLVLVFANRMTSMLTGSNINEFVREGKIITVDIDRYEHQKFKSKINKSIICDIKNFFDIILTKTIKETETSWVQKCQHWKSVFPKCEVLFTGDEKVDLYELANYLSSYLEDDATCITDAGMEELIIPTTITFKQGQRCIHPISQGAMGFALPAAIGSFYAKNNQTVAIIGDGSVMMNLQELQTISYNKLPLKIIIVNNNCYAIIRKRQQDLFRARTIGTDESNGVSCPDFKKIAKAFNLGYEVINNKKELFKLKEILSSKKSIICEILGKVNQQYIHSSYRKSSNGKLVQPPIEDQSPFIDRETFKSEMIIKTID